MRRIIFAFVLLSISIWAQTPTPTPNSSVKNAEEEDPATETGKLKKNCPFKHALGCAEVLFTGQPLHIAVGSMPPQNGFGAGLAYVGHRDTEDWSKSWSADAIASGNASWRAGVYFKLVDTRIQPSTGVFGTGRASASDIQAYVERPVYNFYAQSISLNKLTFFGEGPGSSAAGRSFYGMTEHIVGGNLIRPLYERLNMGWYGEINGRAVDIRPSRGQSSPSIEQIYTSATAPGSANQPFFLQLGAGVRMRPSVFNNLLNFNYDVSYRPFIGVSDSGFSFQRLTADLYQEISLYHKALFPARDTNDPNDCRMDPSDDSSRCPPVIRNKPQGTGPKSSTRNLEGRLGLRAYTVLSMAPGNNVVPFYFQPTLGGSDLNGNPTVSSYQDYRFRAPNILLFQEIFEHSLGSWPLGFVFHADQGKVALTRGDLGANHWIHSFAVGGTLRAGGFPQVYLLFAFGGKEGTHTLANVNTSLLGSAARPSLY